MFAAKPSTSKTEKGSNKSEGDTTKDEDKVCGLASSYSVNY